MSSTNHEGAAVAVAPTAPTAPTAAAAAAGDATEAAAAALHVLSVQSWVVHGFVGNRCALLALQRLGLDTDALNTVQLSNHTGYAGGAAGQRASADEVAAMAAGLRRNGLPVGGGYSHVLTGYVGRADTLRAIVDIVRGLRQVAPADDEDEEEGEEGEEEERRGQAAAPASTTEAPEQQQQRRRRRRRQQRRPFFACDPVMGDDGKLYVPEELVAIYRDEVVPEADALFPNQTECELLTGRTIASQADAFAAMDVLHERGVATVILTSTSITVDADEDHDDCIMLFGSHRESEEEEGGKRRRWRMAIPRLDQSFTGTGDLFSALTVGWMARGVPVVTACERAINSISAVLQATHQAKSHELRLVQNQGVLDSPPGTLKAEDVEA